VGGSLQPDHPSIGEVAAFSAGPSANSLTSLSLAVLISSSSKTGELPAVQNRKNFERYTHLFAIKFVELRRKTELFIGPEIQESGVFFYISIQ
jgi:hypothetical protein